MEIIKNKMLKIILETLDLAVRKVDRIRESNLELTNENRELLKKFSNVLKTSMKILIENWHTFLKTFDPPLN